ncbi:MAG TPA: hypothetical protein VFE60_28325 [Roseiarcus sp.]|jgi:uncharacterized protein YkwD|nr:hypothetical protein [Roseiarcus sp.]
MSELRKFHELDPSDPLLRAERAESVVVKYAALDAQLAETFAKLAELRASLDRMQKLRANEEITKAASAAFREAQS